MSLEFTCEYNLNNTSEEAYISVLDVLTPEYISKYNIKSTMEYDNNSRIAATGKGFTLEILFLNNSIEVHLNLSFIFMPLKRRILTEVKSELEKVI